MVEETTVVKRKKGLLDEERKQLPSLVIIHGNDIGKKFDLHKDQISIGRQEGCDIFLNEEDISRLHATVLLKGKEISIRDENSTNGVFVNTKKIETMVLNDGDLILIGNTILKFMISGSVEKQYHESIYRLATLDGLTQIYNKKYLLEQAESEFGRSRRYQRALSVIIFDFDHFKKVNDVHGHPAGDLILQETSSIVMKNMRKEDTFGRYGGEEFMIIMPETDTDNAYRIADKLRVLLETSEFTYQETTIKVTISAGVAGMSAVTATFEDLLRQCDKALYKAKREGRNRVARA